MTLTETLQATPETRLEPRLAVEVEIVVPVYNEAPLLAQRIGRLRQFLNDSFPFSSVVTVVDNASTDDTYAVACELAARVPGVNVIHLPEKGKGRALRHAWNHSTAPVVAYMDADLSTSLTALLPLVAPLLSGHCDVAIGTRLARGARVVRGPKRELISRAYNLLLRLSLHGRFSDAQCGFKALRREAADRILPLVKDEGWFFDTELLITAERLGLRITEVAVDWVDDPDSHVHVVSTAVVDLKGVWRISHGESRKSCRVMSAVSPSFDQVPAEQLIQFAGVGVVSTLAYLFLFVASRPVLGLFAANALAIAITTLGNTAAHREFSHRLHATRFVAMASQLFCISLGVTSAALAVVRVTDPRSLPLTIVAVLAAHALAAILRFSVLRAWVFRPSASA
jgi:glycosyltransferase involved in cell wall biosynthesis